MPPPPPPRTRMLTEAVVIAAITSAATIGAALVSALKPPPPVPPTLTPGCTLAERLVDLKAPNPDLSVAQKERLHAAAVARIEECLRR